LRLAIEQSAILSARNQLALAQLQLQEAAVTRLSQQYDEVRSRNVRTTAQKLRLATQLRDLESKRNSADAAIRGMLEQQMQDLKIQLDEVASMEQDPRESELAAQLNEARSGLAGSRTRITELERALDAAIQAGIKGR